MSHFAPTAYLAWFRKWFYRTIGNPELGLQYVKEPERTMAYTLKCKLRF